jgi:hypothetical protein
MMVVPESEEGHDGGPPLFLRTHEIIHDDVPALRYLVRIRIVEFQDWRMPPTSDNDDDHYGRNDDTGDSDDSNYNPFYPGFAGPEDPWLGPGHGAPFRARESRATVLVGGVRCPILQTRGTMPCCAGVSGYPGTPGTRVDMPVEEGVDFATLKESSPSFVKPALDPMVDEAALSMPQSCHGKRDSMAILSTDAFPRRAALPRFSRCGFVAKLFHLTETTSMGM